LNKPFLSNSNLSRYLLNDPRILKITQVSSR